MLLVAVLIAYPPFLIDASAEDRNIEEVRENIISFKESIDENTTFGLALSGGGAKGFAHLGVIKVLEEVGMPIDYISGTSMGALVGGLYAMGYSTEYIENLANNINWDDLFTDAIRRRHMPFEEKEWDNLYLVTLPIIERSISLPAGVIAGQRIELLLNQLAWPYPGHQNFLDFPIPFLCMATDIISGEGVILDEGNIAQAIRASISIPSIFQPKEINGRKLVDGGVVRNLPVEELKDLGVDFILGVNVSAPLKDADELFNIVDILDQTITFQISESINRSKKLANLVFESDDIFSVSITDFEEAQKLIDLGEAMAREYYDELKSLADAFNTARSAQPVYPVIPEFAEEIFITDIVLKGVQESSETQVRSKLLIQEKSHINLQDITFGIENIYGLQFFSRVTYYLENDTASDGTEGYRLVLDIQERQQDLFRFGFYYDNYRLASILLNTTFRNFLYSSSITRLNVKLGEEPFVDVRFFNYLSSESNAAISLRLNYSLSQIDLFSENGNTLARYNTNAIFAEGMYIPFTNNQMLVGFGLRQEVFDISARVGDFDFPGGRTTVSQLLTRFQFDNLDRRNFTRRGHKLHIEASQSIDLFDTSIIFFQSMVDWSGYFQLDDDFTIIAGGKIGYATQDALPLHRQFHLGGFPDFAGYRLYEIGSNNIRMLRAGVQFEPVTNRYVGLQLNAASTEDIYKLNIIDSPIRFGWAASLGIDTRIAPVQIAVSGSVRNFLMLQYGVGVMF